MAPAPSEIDPRLDDHDAVSAGAGNAAGSPPPFFVAEPQGRINVNVTGWFRLGFGGGYRFIAGAQSGNASFRGPTAGIILMFGSLSRNP
jgi:hypothetical protein